MIKCWKHGRMVSSVQKKKNKKKPHDIRGSVEVVSGMLLSIPAQKFQELAYRDIPHYL